MEAAESLFECLEQVPDPRMARGVRHPFQAILRLTLLGLVCGQTTMAHIALFARMNWPALKELLGFLRACLRSLQYVKLRLLPEGVIMSHSYSSDISREQFARILPCLESARRRTKPRTVDLYDVFCGVLYLLKSGCQWRMLPADFPDWRTCYKYFRQWSERPDPAKYSILEQVLKKSVDAARRSNGRKERTSFCIGDSQSVKNTDSAENKGYDSGKKVSVWNQAPHRRGHSGVAPCDSRDHRQRYRPCWGFGYV